MRTLRVVEHPPLFDQHLCLPECVKQFSVQQFTSEFAVKGLTVTVLPGATWRDVERFRAQAAQPCPELPGNHLRANTRGTTMGPSSRLLMPPNATLIF